jgi:hypothetical protein
MMFFGDISDAICGIIFIIFVIIPLLWKGFEFLQKIFKWKDRSGRYSGDRVRVKYINASGDHQSSIVDSGSVLKNGDRVFMNFWHENGSMVLIYSRIKNPEVLGLGEEKTEEAEPPILHPEFDLVGDPTGPALHYRRRDGTPGVIYFVEDSVEIIGNRVNLSPKGRTERYAIALDQVLNPEVLEHAAPDVPAVPEGELAPILEPQGIYVGDVTGKELRYSRRDGSTGTIYFDPVSVEIVDNALHLQGRVVLSPKGRPERYSIALEKVLNPEVLFEVAEPKPPLMPEPEPEREPAQFRPGTRVVIDEVPLDSYEAVRVMRRLKPELGPFEIFNALIDKRETLLQGYTENQAKELQGDFQNAGCTVSLQTVGHETGTAIAEPPPQPGVKEKPVPPVIESPPSIGRPPTEEEFGEIRWDDFEGVESNFNEIKHLIESAPIDVNARDTDGIPLVFGVQKTRILGLLLDRGADIHTKCDHGTSILHGANLLSPDVCQMLIQFGADIDARSEQGETPLIRAAGSGKYELAKILIEHGADIQVRPEHGKTALEKAKDHGYYGVSAWMGKPREGCAKIAQLLREHGAK